MLILNPQRVAAQRETILSVVTPTEVTKGRSKEEEEEEKTRRHKNTKTLKSKTLRHEDTKTTNTILVKIMCTCVYSQLGYTLYK